MTGQNFKPTFTNTPSVFQLFRGKSQKTHMNHRGEKWDSKQAQ